MSVTFVYSLYTSNIYIFRGGTHTQRDCRREFNIVPSRVTSMSIYIGCGDILRHSLWGTPACDPLTVYYIPSRPFLSLICNWKVSQAVVQEYHLRKSCTIWRQGNYFTFPIVNTVTKSKKGDIYCTFLCNVSFLVFYHCTMQYTVHLSMKKSTTITTAEDNNSYSTATRRMYCISQQHSAVPPCKWASQPYHQRYDTRRHIGIAVISTAASGGPITFSPPPRTLQQSTPQIRLKMGLDRSFLERKQFKETVSRNFRQFFLCLKQYKIFYWVFYIL